MLGWWVQCYEMCHKWCCACWNCCNSKSHEACCCTGDTQLGLVNKNFIIFERSIFENLQLIILQSRLQESHLLTNTKFIETTKKFFSFDVLTCQRPSSEKTGTRSSSGSWRDKLVSSQESKELFGCFDEFCISMFNSTKWNFSQWKYFSVSDYISNMMYSTCNMYVKYVANGNKCF